MNTTTLEEIRASKGLTGSQFARQLGISKRLYYYLISGERPVPLKVELAACALALGCTGFSSITKTGSGWRKR